jgi:hypothetical protein
VVQPAWEPAEQSSAELAAEELLDLAARAQLDGLLTAQASSLRKVALAVMAELEELERQRLAACQ